MPVKNIIIPLTLQTIDSSTLGAAYQAIDANGIDGPASILRIENDSDQEVTISYDGTNDHGYLGVGQVAVWDFQTNGRPNTNIAALRTGTVIYVKGTAGTGTIAVSGWYQHTN